MKLKSAIIFVLTFFMSQIIFAKGNTIFPATIVSVIDGDTVLVNVKLGMDLELNGKVRVAKYDAPEISKKTLEPELSKGLKAKAYALKLLEGQEVILKTHGKDKYGRILSEILMLDGRDFATVMKEKGFVK